MEYPRCKTCKWWSKQEWPDDAGKRACLNQKLDTLDGKDTLYAPYCDTEVLTGPDFGCVHHEQK